ncbi:RAMP superfamily CRISPR-associated protein [Oceanospirillum beijerinckii]|uniref:RAMP superfamily CRISPR-associated protein n=1 Tax=Oceanospirillum beijerinckii TaxID=64976 RepID=UPI000401C2D9|nr:RAMP superfamily CRISPR-associated protein [Oceanospirillum beijerinckii]
MTMDNHTTQVTQYQLAITLLDDMHTGSGLGNHHVDSFQAKDKDNYPVISRQHLKGLLKVAADEWLKLKQAHPDQPDYSLEKEQIAHLLDDKEGEKVGVQLTLNSAFFCREQAQTDSPFIIWSSSARGKSAKDEKADPFNRAPADDTLRSVEYVRAGSQFKTSVTLFAPTDQAESYQALLTRLLSRIDRVGAKRNRGAGGIQMDISAPTTTSLSASSQASTNNHSPLTLHITNLDPLRLPATQSPGNVIPTATHISGSQLRGALANLARLAGLTAEDGLFSALVTTDHTKAYTISQAYPSPEGTRAIPWPHSLQQSKSQAQTEAPKGLPWWFNSTDKKVQDTLNSKVEDGEKFKRNKSASYLYQSNGHWYHYEQSKSIQMRNKVRTDFLSKEDDSALFSEEVLPEGSHFSAEIRFQTQAQKAELLKLLSWAKENRIPLALGRGKAPCLVTDITSQTLTTTTVSPAETFTLVLASDWLVYNPDTLQPYESLSGQTLNHALQLNLTDEQCQQIDAHSDTISETSLLSGFNFASNLPRRPLEIIAAGSVIKISADLDNDLLEKITSRLNQNQPAGEQTCQGLGQYWCYTGSLTLANTDSVSDTAPENMLEKQLALINNLLTGTPHYSGSASQWQNLVATIYQCHRKALNQSSSSVDAIEGLLNSYISVPGKGLESFRAEKTKDLLDAWVKELTSKDSSIVSADPVRFAELLVNELIARNLITGKHQDKATQGEAQ